jgi:type IV secretion system protein VirB3
MARPNEKAGALERPRTIAIHRSLTRPLLLAGADRELALANGVVVAALLFGIGVSWYTAGISSVLLVIGHWGLVLLAKHDPHLRPIYVRHIQLSAYYPAAPREPRRPPVVHPSVTVSE